MQHALADNLIMLAELTVLPDRLGEFLAYTVENLDLSRSFPGNIAFYILINEVERDKVIFVEVWESPEAQQDYMAWRIKSGDLTRLLSLLADAPKLTPLRRIAS